MKKYYLILVLVWLTFSFNGYSQIKVNSSGDAGIGTTSIPSKLCVNSSSSSDYIGTLFQGTSYNNLVQISGTCTYGWELCVYGDAYCTTSGQSSDEILKYSEIGWNELIDKTKKD
jgi:hypothetical protein